MKKTTDLTIVRPLFTLRFEPVREPNENNRLTTVAYKMFVEDIKYRRGSGTIETFNGVTCRSICYLDTSSIISGCLYLPGKENKQEWTFISKNQFKKLRGNRLKGKDCFIVNGNSLSCKESACHYIISNSLTSFNAEFVFTEKQAAWLKKLSPQPLVIEGSKISIDKWWLTYKRIGWLLLATRLVAGDYYFKSDLIKKKFLEFSEGIEDDKYMTYSHNWQYHYEPLV